MSSKCVIRIDENGPRIESNGNVVSSDLRLTLKDYLPNVTNWTTWNGVLNKDDEINISTPYSFIAVRARNLGTESGSTILGTGNDYLSACLPANNSLASNCGCNGDSGESSSNVLLDFDMNQQTTYTLDSKTIYSENTHIFDCSHGTVVTGAIGWTGCECSDTIDCDCCGATGSTGATGSIGITGELGATCIIGATALETVLAKGVYQYAFSGVLRDNNIVIKTEEADNDYPCKLEYYAYSKVDNDYILFIFDDTHGKWLLIRLDEKINDIIVNKIPYNIIEVIEWSETNYTYETSNITMPSKEDFGSNINSYEGSVSEIDENMPVIFKINSLLIMESKTFTGKIVSKLDNLDVNVMLAI